MERSKSLSIINEMTQEERSIHVVIQCTKWSQLKCLVENVYTTEELKLTGNCLRGSRPLLSFDPTFTEKPHYSLLKELFTQIFGVPKHHPKSQPFFDHVYTFSILDNRIWFRNFQILSEDGALAEVGPRFVLNPVKIFSGSFGGVALWENPLYVSPAKYHLQVRLAAKNKYVNRVEQKMHAEATRPKDAYKLTPLEDIFKGDPLETADKIIEDLEKKISEDNAEKKSDVADKKRKNKKAPPKPLSLPNKVKSSKKINEKKERNK
ncbi:hypothetical protein JTB14_031102 [Gonioctena quinquepunctata]|nr:hypothetical protein JTB14_031102 [Gonioctena quinquepunctata]